ncbi:MAG: cation-translocating P-type ATPase, partial [Christensenellales bacterium]
MKYYDIDAAEVLSALRTRPEGLTGEEAARLRGEHGANKLEEGKRIGTLRRFFNQFADPMIWVLLAAAGLSAITAAYAGESYADVIIILAVVLMNATLGVVQESKAEEAIAALRDMTAATSKALRDGQIATIKSEELVPGDIILIEAGDAVPADARIIECASIKIEEAALTGESVPVEKTAEAFAPGAPLALGDRANMAYMGTVVVYGRGKAVVCETGMRTEMGKIAGALSDVEDEKTPLQRRLSALSRVLTYLVLAISAVMFVVGIARAGALSAEVALDTFVMAVSLAVAAIPEGLAAVVTVVLSIGVTRMSRQNAVIRRLTAVETLGCAQVICSDKTGTLTQNRMRVVETHAHDNALLARAMALCSDAVAGEDGQIAGEPTEAALVAFTEEQGTPKRTLEEAEPRVAEAPFDSMRKMMSTVHARDDQFVQYTKGAPDEILARCTHAVTESGIMPMTEEIRASIRHANREMAGRALRVLAAAYRAHETLPADTRPEALEAGLTFAGLTGMIDPVRPEVKDAVDRCRAAGVAAVMITGDHIDTAAAIARELGILTDPAQAITGHALDELSDAELDRRIEDIRVYARVRPEHKVRIVSAWKRRGKVTAMTGDGVNDAPSIKAADIGIGMGITGTDVTKNVADMILADDNFATIVSAVAEGRTIYANIRKAVQFLLSSNLSEVIAIFTATILGFTILRPAHILWINLVTDSLPALALGLEQGEPDAMQKPPRDPSEGIFAGGMGVDIGYQGLLVAILTLAAYFIGHRVESGLWEIANSPDGMTMAFLTMSMAEAFQSINMRSQRGSIFRLPTHNFYLYGASFAALVLTAAVIYLPFLRRAF